MFDKLKQLKKLKDLQDDIKKEKFDTEKNGVRVVMDGTFNVEEVSLNPNLSQAEQERAVREAFNENLSKIQSSVAQKFSGLSGLMG